MPDLLDCRKIGFFAAVLAVAADFTFPLATDASFTEPFPFAADLDFSPAEDFEIEDFEIKYFEILPISKESSLQRFGEQAIWKRPS